MTTHRTTADYYAGIPNYTTQLAAENDRLRTAIREALDFESALPAIATVPRRILENALNVEGMNQ